ncbi:ilvB operon leader peptide IvbL [Klebsiella pneumoniae]|nr:ilvB operon leader peptide IvbL [Klebsiella pneumoniae]
MNSAYFSTQQVPNERNPDRFDLLKTAPAAVVVVSVVVVVGNAP